MDRVGLLRRGIALEGVTVGYNALEGMVAIVAGIAAGSVALTGFGVDSVIEVTSGALLWWGRRPESSLVGIVLTTLSLIVMPLLARAKLGLAASLGSRALRADAHETIVCAWLSTTTLLGLGLNALLGWWWADPVAALGMLPLIVREGIEAWRGDAGEGEVA